MTTFNSWLLNKILAYLSTKEGFSIEEPEVCNNTIKATIQDTFGFRYEVQIKMIARINDPIGDRDNVFIKSNLIDFLEER